VEHELFDELGCGRLPVTGDADQCGELALAEADRQGDSCWGTAGAVSGGGLSDINSVRILHKAIVSWAAVL
jgi:hypothetical protein